MSNNESVSAGELRRRLAERLDDVLGGTTFTVTRGGRPTATLGPVRKESDVAQEA